MIDSRGGARSARSNRRNDPGKREQAVGQRRLSAALLEIAASASICFCVSGAAAIGASRVHILRSLQKMAAISTVEGIERRFHELATRLGMKNTSGRFNTTPQHDGTPHIEQVGDEFHFVVTERGSEFERRRTRDADDILYWLFDGFTQGMATDYELKHRDESRDGREIWFPYQERLLADLNPEWGARKQEAHMRILRDHPMHPNNQANKAQHPTA